MIPLRTEPIDALLEAHPVAGVLDAAGRADLVATGTDVHLEDGAVLYTSGTPATEVFFTLGGAMQIEYPLAPETRGRVTAMLLAPGFLGECQVLHQLTWSGTGVAVGSLRTLAIDGAAFWRLIDRHPALTRALYLELTGRFLRAIEAWRQEPEQSAEGALVRYLVARTAAQAHAGGSADVLTLRQTDIARASGIRPETVNRVLSAWSKAGIVVRDDAGLRIADIAGFEALHAGGLGSLLQRCALPGR